MNLAPMPMMEDISSVMAISSVMGSLSFKDQTVRLTRQYKGITLAQEARVLEVTPESAMLQTTPGQCFPWMDGEIHVHNKNLPQPVAARMHSINLAQGMIMLSDLAYTEWKNRMSERVQPQKPTYVKIDFHKHSYRALLEDISLEGIGILANRNVDPEGRIRVGIKLALSFQLSQDYIFKGLKGMLVYRQKTGLQLIKFGIHLYPDEGQRAGLAEIVNQRREEILQELEQAYMLAHEPQRIENLYF